MSSAKSNKIISGAASRNKKYSFWNKVKNNKAFLLMLSPAVIYFIIFSYLPMVGLVLAFKDYNYQSGIFGSAWNGFNNFKFFFDSGAAWTVTRNTVLYNLAFLIVNTVTQLFAAILISELKGKFFKKIFQSMLLLPYFISWVAVGAFFFNFVNYDYGIINNFLRSLGMSPVSVYGEISWWKYIIVFVSSWKWIGYGSILYLAGIMSIDTSMYDSCKIDGANVFQEIWHITIPSLVPQIIILTLIQIGRLFRGDFEMFYQLVGRNGLLYEATDVIDVFVFRSLMELRNFGLSTAVGLYQSVLCFVIILLSNYAIRRYQKDYALF